VRAFEIENLKPKTETEQKQ